MREGAFELFQGLDVLGAAWLSTTGTSQSQEFI
jgi:hypothetical protein